ncbi:MAG: hypothetical protein AB2803_02695 [Candidatus Thiodiazotropha sp.]
MNLIPLLPSIKALWLKNLFPMPLISLKVNGFNQRNPRLLQAGFLQTVTATSKKLTRNPVPSSDNMIIHTFRLFMTSFTIGLLYSPLIAYAFYLWHNHTGSTDLVTLHWYELLLLATLLLLPLGAMKLLKISWTVRDIPH